jgi:hypothetical protein
MELTFRPQLSSRPRYLSPTRSDRSSSPPRRRGAGDDHLASTLSISVFDRLAHTYVRSDSGSQDPECTFRPRIPASPLRARIDMCVPLRVPMHHGRTAPCMTESAPW